MTTDNQAFKYNELSSELLAKFTELPGKGIIEEIEYILNFKEHFLKRLFEYKKNSAKAIENNSIRAILFENASFGNSVFELLEETFTEKTSSDVIIKLDNYFQYTYRILEVIPESRFVSMQIEKVCPDYLSKAGLIYKIKTGIGNFIEKVSGQNPGNDPSNSLFETFKNFANRNFFFHFLVVESLRKQIGLYENFLANIVKLLKYLWSVDKERIALFSNIDADNFDTNISINSLIQKVEKDEFKTIVNEIRLLNEKISNNIVDCIESFFKDYYEGKIIPEDGFSSKTNPEKECKILLSNISKIRNNWNNTVFLLSEDWKLDLEIHSLRFSILKEYFDFSNAINNKFTIPVDEKLNLIKNVLVELKSKLENTERKNEESFINEYINAKIEFKRQVVLKLLPAVKDIIIKSNIPGEIDNIETTSIRNFNSISPKRYILKNPEYDRPIQRSEFDSISPQELLAYEMMPDFKSVFPGLKTAFIKHVQAFETKVTEIPQIIEFAIESANAYLGKNDNIDEAVKIGTNGIDRAENKLNDLLRLHKTFINKEIERLKESIEGFIKEITVIADNESAYQIKLRITKLKAIERSKAIRTKVLNQIRNILPVIIEYFRKSVSFLRRSSEKISKQLLYEEKRHFITTDTSDYLTATEASISKLPYIYQRLFKIEALETFEMYIDRQESMDILFKAYKKWKEGKFAPTAVIGEKGSGKTSLINRFIKTKIHNEKVIHLDLHTINMDPEGVYNEIEKEIGKPEISDDKNVSPQGSIVIIDGLERLFISEINGFRYLLKTMKLISERSKDIFWIISCHLYSWIFVDKIYKISDYFGYHVKLGELSAEDIENIIMRRHNISGFKLVFESFSPKRPVVNFKKLTDDEEQQSLKQDYFKYITEFNKSNIAQAFLYWLRSTLRLEDDTVYIRKIGEMDENFVDSVSRPKMIALKNILIHNGITIDGHSRIFGQDEEMSKLTLDQMLDDGLLIKKHEYYYINPLIYSQIVNQFYKLNLLH